MPMPWMILPLTLRLGLWQALVDDLPLRETTHACRGRGAPQRFSARHCLKCNKGRRRQLMGLISWPAVSNYHVISCTHQPTPQLIWRQPQSRYFEAVSSFCATKSLNNNRGGFFSVCGFFVAISLSAILILLFPGLERNKENRDNNF